MKTRALLVGIDNYNRISRLKGCVGDINKVEHYLLQTFTDIDIIKLLDEHATKKLIVAAFKQMKTNLSNDDSFLLYFAGHGTREYADSIWKETNGRLECIVCYDENPDLSTEYLLADKELRYLIHDLSKTGSHIVTIFDCCHSGGNTRSEIKNMLARGYPYTFPKRKWEEFIFSKTINEHDVFEKSASDFLPQGTHVQIAACESDELAYEDNGEGVFTKNLLKVLEDTGGKISYYNLRKRIRQYIRFNYPQQPRIYTIGKSDNEIQNILFTRFLNKQYVGEDHFVTEAVYNRKKGWMLNLGAIHGINKKSSVDLVDPVLPGKLHSCTIKEIFVDYTLLELKENFITLFDHTALKASIKDFVLNELILYVDLDENCEPTQLEKINNTILIGAEGRYALTGNETLANYVLHVKQSVIYLTQPKDPFRPITKPIFFTSDNLRPDGVNELVEYLKHISRWNFIQQLYNPSMHGFTREPIHVQIIQTADSGQETTIDIINDGQGTGQAALQPFVRSHLKISLTNKTGQKLYVAVAYLSYNFQVFLNLMEDKVELLDAGSTAFLGIRNNVLNQTSNLITLKLPDVIEEYNWPGYKETIKIIISHEEFSHEALALDPLPPPYTLKGRTRSTQPDRRSFDFEDDDEDKPVSLNNWMTQTIELSYPNVFYNKVGREKINQMLQWDKMAFFARGLYDNEITVRTVR